MTHPIITQPPETTMTDITTIGLREAFIRSRKIYDAALENMKALTGKELIRALDSVPAHRLGLVLDSVPDDRLGLVLANVPAHRLGLVLANVSAHRLGLVLDSVPIIADLDAKIAAAVGDGKGTLNMARWHCGTTHCRGGWIVTLAGPAGAALEAALTTETAARLIYEASTGTMAPDFFANDKDALSDIRKRAGLV